MLYKTVPVTQLENAIFSINKRGCTVQRSQLDGEGNIKIYFCKNSRIISSDCQFKRQKTTHESSKVHALIRVFSRRIDR